MDFLKGNKEDFLNFLNSINDENVAVLTHTDLDGISSAIFLNEILKEKGIECSYLNFLSLDKGLFSNVWGELIENNIEKIFVCDISADADLEDFEKLRKEFDVFLIDHHPFDGELESWKNVVKAGSDDCAGLMVYELGEELFDREKWRWLLDAVIIADFSFKKKENLEKLKENYSEINEENIFESISGILVKKIDANLTYFEKDLRKVYDMVYNKEFDKLEETYLIIQKEIDSFINKFEEDAEFFPEKNLYIYYFKPKFKISSTLSTLISLKYKTKSLIFIVEDTKDENYLKMSARNQNASEDMNKLLKKGIEGLEDANAGGHAAASGARIMKKDLDEFKKNLLS